MHGPHNDVADVPRCVDGPHNDVADVPKYLHGPDNDVLMSEYCLDMLAVDC